MSSIKVKPSQFLQDIIFLIRPHQWYKNLLVFAALFFSFELFDFGKFLLVLKGLVFMILISGAGYVFNDIIDIKRDRLSPDKKIRPMAAGRLSLSFAYIFGFSLYILGFLGAYLLNANFFLILLILALSTFIYSIYFKHVVFADILFISINFVLRALGGVFLINVPLSIWFLTEIFFLAFFLVAAKRYGDLCTLDKTSLKYKPVLEFYSKELLNGIIIVFMAGLVIMFGLYAHFTNKEKLFYLYPLFIYPILRYYYLIHSEHPYIRNPENFVLKKRDYHLIISSGLFVVLVFFIFYI